MKKHLEKCFCEITVTAWYKKLMFKSFALYNFDWTLIEFGKSENWTNISTHNFFIDLLIYNYYLNLKKSDHLPRTLPYNLFRWIMQKQPPRDVLRKRCSENMQQIYRRTPMQKCDFNKEALQLYWNHTFAWVFSCKFQNTFY